MASGGVRAWGWGTLCLALLASCGHYGGGGRDSSLLTSNPAQADILRQRRVVVRAKAKSQLEKMLRGAKHWGPKAREYLASNLFLKAAQTSLAGDYESSTLVYEYVLKLAPQDAYVAFKYAVDLVQLGKTTQALSLLEQYYPQSGPYWERFSLLLGGIYTSHRKRDLAIKMYRNVLGRNSQHVEACIFLSREYFQGKKTSLALQTLQRCERDSPQRGVLSYYRGKMELSLNRVKRAQRAFQKSLQEEPAFYQSALALGLILENQKQMAQAIEVYQELLQHWPTNQVILAHLVQVLFEARSDSLEVTDYAHRLVLLDPSNLNLKVKLAITYADREAYDKAIKLFEQVLVKVPESDKVLYYLAVIYQELEEYQKSIGLFLRIPQASALYVEGSLEVAQMLSDLAVDDQDAEARLLDFVAQRAGESKLLQLELQVFKGRYYELSGRLRESIEAIEQVAAYPGFSDARRLYLATLQDRAHNYSRSIDLAEQVLKNNPKDARALNFIGYSYLERSIHLDQAYQYIQRAVELSPKNGQIRDSLGWYFYKEGKLDLALRELQLAHRLEGGEDSTITKHLALVYEALNRYDLAREFYLKTLDLAKEQSEKDEALQFIHRLGVEGRRSGRYPAQLP